MLVKDIKTEIRILTRCGRCNDILRSGERDEQTDSRFVLYLEPCDKCLAQAMGEGRSAAITSMNAFAKKELAIEKSLEKKRKELERVEAEGGGTEE